MDKSIARGQAGLSNEVLEAILESAPVALILADDNGIVRWANREVERMFGYSRDELVDHLIDVLVPHPSRTRHASLRKAFFINPSARPMGVGRELYGQRKDGSQVAIEIGLMPIQTPDGPRVLSVIVDMTYRRNLEADVRRVNEELERRVHERTRQLEQANLVTERLLVEIEAKRAELEKLSREDPLTHLSNRRDFDQRLESEIQRAERHGSPLAVAMLDLDRFKCVNDRFGHLVGDAVLRQVAVLIRRRCRAIDIIGRYGGEEFAIALPGTDALAAAVLCERIRVGFEEFDWNKLREGLSVTVSAGVSAWVPGADALTLLAKADANLYEAKRLGRNRVQPLVAA